MSTCDYCGGRTPATAERCGNCGAAITSPGSANAHPRASAWAWREWSPVTWFFVVSGVLILAPVVLWLLFAFSMMAMMVVWSAVPLLVFGAMLWGVWSSHRRWRA